MPCVAAGKEVRGIAIGPDNHNNSIIIIIIVIIINCTPSGRGFCIDPSAMYMCFFLYYYNTHYDRIIIRWSLYLYVLLLLLHQHDTSNYYYARRVVDQVVATRQRRRRRIDNKSILLL